MKDESQDAQLSSVYEWRFRNSPDNFRRAIWKALIDGYFSTLIPKSGVVLDFGCGKGEFLSQIEASQRVGIDVEDMLPEYAKKDIDLRLGVNALSGIPSHSVDVFFASNTFEHLPNKGALEHVLGEVVRVLKPGGRCVILTPNIALKPGRYWDYHDHHIPLTERSLNEALVLAGLEPEFTIRRFLPWSTGRRIPFPYALVRTYLAVRPLWFFLGKQSLVVAKSSCLS